MCEIHSKLTIKTPELRQWRRSGVFIVKLFVNLFIVNFIVNFTHISHLFLVFLLLTLSEEKLAGIMRESLSMP